MDSTLRQATSTPLSTGQGRRSSPTNTVDVAIMCTEAKARAFRPDDNELEDDTHNAIKSLGVNRIYEVLRQAQHRLSRISR